MNMNQYQHLAARTINKNLTANQLLINAALGLAGEAGEAADHIKKVFFQGHPLDPKHITKELGDIMWYVAEMCTALTQLLNETYTMNDVAENNIEKLKKRYPEGFSTELSLNRKE